MLPGHPCATRVGSIASVRDRRGRGRARPCRRDRPRHSALSRALFAPNTELIRSRASRAHADARPDGAQVGLRRLGLRARPARCSGPVAAPQHEGHRLGGSPTVRTCLRDGDPGQAGLQDLLAPVPPERLRPRVRPPHRHRRACSSSRCGGRCARSASSPRCSSGSQPCSLGSRRRHPRPRATAAGCSRGPGGSSVRREGLEDRAQGRDGARRGEARGEARREAVGGGGPRRRSSRRSPSSKRYTPEGEAETKVTDDAPGDMSGRRRIDRGAPGSRLLDGLGAHARRRASCAPSLQDLVIVPLVPALRAAPTRGVAALHRLDGPFILASNHQSHADTSVIIAALPRAVRRRLVVAAASDVFFSSRIRGDVRRARLQRDPDRAQPGRAALAPRWRASCWRRAGGCSSSPRGTAPRTGASSSSRAARPTSRTARALPIVPCYLENTRFMLPRLFAKASDGSRPVARDGSARR